MITGDEAQQALGERVQPPQGQPFGICQWRGTGTDGISIQPVETGQAGFENAKARTSNTVALSGIGDAAFAFVSQAGFVQVHLLKNGRYVVITVQSRGGANLNAAKAVAAKVASRL